MIYILLLIITVIFSSINYRLTSRTRICFILFLGIFMILLMGLRYRVGIDTLNYIDKYDTSPTFKELFQIDFSTTRFEPGYLFLCSLCRSITHDFWLLQLVHSLLLTTSVYIFIYKNTYNPFSGIAIYIVLCWLYFNTEIIRESLSISIFLFNYENYKNRRWIKYYLLSLLSICFQYSAIITLFFPLVRLIKFNLLYVAGCIMILGITPYLENINQLIEVASVANRIDEHIGSAETLNMNWRVANMIRYAFVPIYALMMSRYTHNNSEFTSVILVSILFGIGAFAIPIIFSRLANYTLPFVVVYVANTLEWVSKSKLLKNSLLLLIICSQLLYYREMFNAWYPYESIFTQQTIPERELMWYNYFN